MRTRLTTQQAAQYVGCSVGEILRGRKTGRFPYIKLGGRYLFSPEALDECLRIEEEISRQRAREACKSYKTDRI